MLLETSKSIRLTGDDQKMTDRSTDKNPRSTSHAADLGVVVTSVSGHQHLEECLRALQGQVGMDMGTYPADEPAQSLGIIVVDRLGLKEPAVGSATSLSWIAVPRSTSMSEMRLRGLEACRSPYLAVIEDHCVPAPNWACRLLDELKRHRAVVGGVIENGATGRAWKWAAFFCEYGAFAVSASQHGGPCRRVPLNNFGFPRTLSASVHTVLSSSDADGVVLDRLHKSSLALRAAPEASVRHNEPGPWTSYVARRFHAGRVFAADRVARWSLPKRSAFAFLLLALPPLLLTRILGHGWRARGLRLRLLWGLPWTVLFVVVGVAGEQVGTLVGRGTSAAKDW